MLKPIMNLDDVEFDDIEENGPYTSSRGQIGSHIGARKLGYDLTVLPPGKVQCPFHCHHEMFLIIEGEGELRFGDKRYPIRKHDAIACPPGGPVVAHQIINTGKYPTDSTRARTAAVPAVGVNSSPRSPAHGLHNAAVHDQRAVADGVSPGDVDEHRLTPCRIPLDFDAT